MQKTKNSAHTKASELTQLLACDCCGWIEKQPYDDGDECICGGRFRLYNGDVRKIGNIEFAQKS